MTSVYKYTVSCIVLKEINLVQIYIIYKNIPYTNLNSFKITKKCYQLSIHPNLVYLVCINNTYR